MVLMFWEFSVRVLLAGLVAGELYLLMLRGRAVFLRIAYFLVLAVGWTIVYYLVEPATANRLTYPQTFFWYLVIVHTVPVACFGIGLELASKLASRYLRHLALGILVLVIALFWPSFAVLMHCGMLECF